MPRGRKRKEGVEEKEEAPEEGMEKESLEEGVGEEPLEEGREEDY